MKIQRIKKIKNYRIFHDFNWPSGLPDFSKYNLIYGWNGSGKTTLSDLFAYLQRNEDIDTGDIRFQIDNSTVLGNNISGSVIPQMRVFNRDTVDRSLFEVPNHELPPVFYLGEDSADKQMRIEELKVEREGFREEKKNSLDKLAGAEKELDSFCKNKAAEIKALLTSAGGGLYNFYNKTDFAGKCEQFLTYNKSSFCLLPEAHSKCLGTKDGVALDKINAVPTNLPDYSNLINQVSELLKRSVTSKVISDLADSPEIASWVQKGLSLHTAEGSSTHCHFCTNVLPAERIQALESHFNDQLTSFQSEIDSEILAIESSIKAVETLSLPSGALFYPHYKEVYEKSLATWSKTKSMVSLFLNSLIKALKQKREQPFKEIYLNNYLSISGSSEEERGTLMKVLEFFADATQSVSVVLGLSALQKINEIIREHNDYSDNFGLEVDKSRRDLEIHMVATYLTEYQVKNEEIVSFGQDVKSVNDKLELVENQIVQLEREIKEFVKPVVELNIEMEAYLGRGELKFEVKGNGYVITRNGHPAMNLSEGERTAIAFMYFLKTLEDTEFDMANGVVVIDDPISSLDANSMYSAFGFMKDRTKDINQLFVLTHSFTFFRQVRGWFFRQPGQNKKDISKQPSRFYMLDTGVIEGNRASAIKEIDPLLKDYESEYQYLFKRIHDFVDKGDEQRLEHYYGLPNMARRMLESFLTFKMPNFTASSIEKNWMKLTLMQLRKLVFCVFFMFILTMIKWALQNMIFLYFQKHRQFYVILLN